VLAFTVIVIGLAACGSGRAQAQEKLDLKETVKWAVWHEGCRIYAADNSIGDTEEIRECIVDVYAHNDEAQQLVRDAKPHVLLAAIRAAGSEIPGERQLSQYIEFACKHEQLLDRFYDLENEGDYEGMRTLYFETFKDNEKARNLLAAVSNETLCDMVNVLR
jgi:hypothetical protein